MQRRIGRGLEDDLHESGMRAAIFGSQPRNRLFNARPQPFRRHQAERLEAVRLEVGTDLAWNRSVPVVEASCCVVEKDAVIDEVPEKTRV
jgi:hypothetical protein